MGCGASTNVAIGRPVLAAEAPDDPAAVAAAAERRTLRARFDRTDANADGQLTLDEFAKHLGLAPDSTEAGRLFAMLDKDGDGAISPEEWMAAAGGLPIEGVTLRDPSGDLYLSLKDAARVFIYNLLGFLASRDAVEKSARKVLPDDYMAKYASFKYDEHMRQRRLAGSGPVRNYDELAADAAEAMPLFAKLMRHIVGLAGLDPDAAAMHDGQPLQIDKDHTFKVLTVAPLKSRARCDEKVPRSRTLRRLFYASKPLRPLRLTARLGVRTRGR